MRISDWSSDVCSSDLWVDKRGTRWRLAALPLGGYVKFAGDMNAARQPDRRWLELSPHERAQCFPSKPLWQRALIVAAGPAINFLFAIVVDRKSTRLNSSHYCASRMPSSP